MLELSILAVVGVLAVVVINIDKLTTYTVNHGWL